MQASRRTESSDPDEAAWWPRLHSFSVGLKGSPDLAAAAQVAAYLKTVHHQFEFTVQEGLDAVEEVIYHLETYDVTTVRASTPVSYRASMAPYPRDARAVYVEIGKGKVDPPGSFYAPCYRVVWDKFCASWFHRPHGRSQMFLMSRKIKALGVKMVLSGEGADEVFGGYLYFHKAPSKEALHTETVDKVIRARKRPTASHHSLGAILGPAPAPSQVMNLHQFDCLRANKSTMAWGVEARVPFLDADFLDYAMSVDPVCKMVPPKGMEKDVLRRAFDTPEDPSVSWHTFRPA